MPSAVEDIGYGYLTRGREMLTSRRHYDTPNVLIDEVERGDARASRVTIIELGDTPLGQPVVHAVIPRQCQRTTVYRYLRPNLMESCSFVTAR